MDIKMIPIGKLKPYEKNPRKNDGAVDAVAASIKEFGFKNPVVVDRNNTIVAGHTRYKAAKKLGLKEIPCIDASDLTDEQVKAFRLADNKTHELSDWDLPGLNDELDNIFSIDMSKFGFGDLGDLDYSDKNKEIDLLDDAGSYTIKLNYAETEYAELTERLRGINAKPE